MNRTFEQIVPGTLCAGIGSKQISAIELGIMLGKEIQVKFSDIAEKYKNDWSLSKLVAHFRIETVFNVKFKVAETAVYRALSGYDGTFRNITVDAYPGLLSKEELKKHGEDHNQKSGEIVGKKMFENKKGFFAFTQQEKDKARHDSIIASGNVPYTEEELDYIELLASQKEYQKGSCVKVFEIAFEVNLKFHRGAEVRTASTITKARIRRRKREELKKAKIAPDSA